MEYIPIPSNTTNLNGLFQNWRYFYDRRDEIKTIFTLPHLLEQQYATYYKSLLERYDKEKTIVIHVRRGDYLSDFNGVLNHLNEDYYAKSIEKSKQIVGQDASFLIFSDDPDWCAKQHLFESMHVVNDSDETRTFWIMSRFSNYIMSNSTFCWWSVFLGTPYATVIAPLPWHSPLAEQKTDDVYLTGWHKMPVIKSERKQ